MANGQQINSGQGNVVYEEATTATVTGSAATAAAGTEVPSTSIRLRSRKVGGGAASFLLTGQFSTVQQETPVKQVSALLATPAVSGAQGAFAKSRSSALTGILIQILQTSIGPQSGTWDINTVTFTQGTSGSSQLPVPSGYTVGGFFQLVTGSLPSGVTLSDSGLLSYDGSGAVASSSVTFSYTEPGALPTLTLHSTSAGTFPYMATIYPTEGAVPSGQILLSPDDSTFRSTVLSTWPDGSAQVMVGAGRKTVAASSTTTVRMRPGSTSGTNLTTTNIASVFTSGITVNFGTSLNLNTWSSPDLIWWQNPEVICARYRLPITNKGSMEAVIDVHAFADGSAFVEVVIENGKINTTTPVTPVTQTYTNATVSVNGTTIATVSSPTTGQSYQSAYGSGTYAGGHEAFRAWYCSGWVGGDPGITVTHDATSLRSHPAFFRPAEENTLNLATTYSNATYDVYAPWKPCRVRVPGMGGGADYDEIATYTGSQSHYLQTGDKSAATAVINHSLGTLCCSINYRSSSTNLVCSGADMAGKSGSANTWPVTGSSFPGWTATEPQFEGAHQPAHGMVAFLCRPSPCFIEVAQKIYAWNFAYADSGSGNGSHPFNQPRGRAWTMRNYGHAIFVTPDALSTWKDAARASLNAERILVDAFLDVSWNHFGIVWDWTAPTADNDQSSSRPGYQHSFFQQNFMGTAFNVVSRMKVLQGSQQTAFDTMTDRILGFQVRWISDAVNYEWRFLPYQPTVGTESGGTITASPVNLATLTRQEMSGSAYLSAGDWRNLYPTDFNYDTLQASTDLAVDDQGGTSYAAQYIAALTCAVERDISGASAAWDRMAAGITDLSTWRQAYRTNPRFNFWPRNK